MNKSIKAKENWTGKIFANGWKIIEKYNCAQYRKIYEEATNDFSKKIKNAHYKVINTECGIETYMERTVIQRAINNKTPVMSKCNGCINGSRLDNETCYYAEMCRNKHLGKTPDRTPKVEVGKTCGNFYVESIISSGNSPGHQCKAIVKCIHCGAIKKCSFSHLLECSVACECFKNHSSGEKLVQEWLNKHDIKNQSEFIFNDLYGIGGGSLRYDFAILDQKNQPIKLIEIDGNQHFEEAGSFYNPNGTIQIHDDLKNKYAEEHNIPLLRITYDQLLNLDNIILPFLKVS